MCVFVCLPFFLLQFQTYRYKSCINSKKIKSENGQKYDGTQKN